MFANCQAFNKGSPLDALAGALTSKFNRLYEAWVAGVTRPADPGTDDGPFTTLP